MKPKMKIVVRDTSWNGILIFWALEPGDVFRNCVGDFYVKTRTENPYNAMSLTGKKPFDFIFFKDEEYVEYFPDACLEVRSLRPKL